MTNEDHLPCPPATLPCKPILAASSSKTFSRQTQSQSSSSRSNVTSDRRPSKSSFTVDKEKLARLDQDYHDLFKMANRHLEDNARLSSENDALRERLNEARVQSDKVRARYGSLLNDVENKDKEIERLEDEGISAENELEDMKHDLGMIEEELAKAQAEVNSTLILLERQKNKSSQCEAQNDELKDLVAKEVERHRVIKQELVMYKDQNQKLEVDLQTARKRYTAEREEHQIKIQQHHEVNTELGKIQVELTRSRKEFQNTISEKDGIIVDLQKQLARYTDSKVEIKTSKKRKASEDV